MEPSFPFSVAVLEYNARMRRQDLANARECWVPPDFPGEWPLASEYEAAAVELDDAAKALATIAALRAERDAMRELIALGEDVPKLRAERDELHRLLGELHATVLGECPSLLNEDSGGNAELDLDIEAALTTNQEPTDA